MYNATGQIKLTVNTAWPVKLALEQVKIEGDVWVMTQPKLQWAMQTSLSACGVMACPPQVWEIAFVIDMMIWPWKLKSKTGKNTWKTCQAYGSWHVIHRTSKTSRIKVTTSQEVECHVMQGKIMVCAHISRSWESKRLWHLILLLLGWI